MSTPAPPAPPTTPPPPGRTPNRWVEAYFRLAPVTVPFYAMLLALALGSIVMLATGANPVEAYAALFRGAFGTPERIAASLARSTPFIGAALAVAFGFKAGLFNIGAEGQLLVGALAGAWVGTFGWLAGLPGIVTIPMVVLAGALGGMLWGGIPGVLKARTGAHEVIVTIMLNAIALRLTEWLVSSRTPVLLLDTSSSVPRTSPIAASARLPALFAEAGLHSGLLLVVALVAMVWFVLGRTTTGFEIHTVGSNPKAATYAGISVNRTIILVMAVSGGLAGITGAAQVSGGQGFLSPGIFANVGFDAIAIALLARANPWGVIPAALLWGSLLSGAPLMQLRTGMSIDVVIIVQALIVLFIAADAIVRWIFRVRTADGDAPALFATGWGS